MSCTLLIAIAFGPVGASAAEIMFEGYYRIELEGKPIGFTVQRYEYDAATKTFLSTYFLKVKIGETTSQESLRAKANDKFQPIGYQYTSQDGTNIKTIDATFNKEVATLVIDDGKGKKTMTSKSPKGTFLSNFLGYLMLQNGLDVGKKFKYSGVAEEDGNSYWGEAWIKENTKFLGLDAVKVLNKFKGENFIAYITKKNEVLGTSSPAKNLSTTLKATAAEATEGQVVPNKVLTQLFGNVPVGRVNPISAGVVSQPPKSMTTAPAAEPAPGKNGH
jgi:hypothetical protein